MLPSSTSMASTTVPHTDHAIVHASQPQRHPLVEKAYRPSHSTSADIATSSWPKEEAGHVDLDPVAICKLRRKIDRNIMPLLCTLYLFAFLGRNNIGNARIAGLPGDLELSTTEYNISVSIFYIGYVVFVVPSSTCLKKFGPRIWLFCTLTAWCAVMASMSSVHSAAALFACRFFLGVAECGLFPGAVLMLSLWYTKEELAVRMGLFFGAAAVSGAFGGILAHAIILMEGTLGLRGWRWLFIIEAVPVLLMMLVVVFVMPNFPEKAAFLTEEERALAIRRLQMDGSGSAVQTGFSWPQFWMVFKDGKTYMYSIIYMLSAACVYSMAVVTPSIVHEFGLNPALTQLLTAPAYVVAFFCTIVMALSSDSHRERGWHFAGPLLVCSAGYVLLIITKNESPVARYICLTIAISGAFSSAPALLAWFSANIGGQTKRGVATALIISIGNCGGAVGGQVYRGNDAAHGYIRGHIICAGFAVCGAVVTLALKYMLIRENKRRDRLTQEEFEREAQGEDLCDNHPSYRYWT